MRGRLLVATLLLACAGGAGAMPGAEPGDPGLRQDLQMLEDAGIVRGLHGTWPVPWADIERQLDAYEGTRLLPTVARVRARARRAGAERGFSGAVGTRMASEPEVLRGYADTPREDAEASVRLGYRGSRFSGRLAAQRVDTAADGINPRYDGSFVAGRLGNWQLGVGALDRWWGPGHDGSMILSTNARPIPGVYIDRDTSEAFEHPWLAWLGPWRLSTFLGKLESDRVIPDARFFGMRVTAEPIDGVTIALQRSMIFGGRGKSSDLDTFWDLWLGRSNVGINLPEDADNPGDQTAGWDARINLSRWGVPAAVYTQYLGMDRYTLPTAHIGQYGVETWGELADGGTWRGFLEYSNSLASFTSGNGWLNVAYNHSVWRSGYRHRGRVIGHTIDGDARVWSAGAIINRANGHTIDLVARAALLNRNDRQRHPEPLFEAETRAWSSRLAYTLPRNDWTFTGYVGTQRFSRELRTGDPSPAFGGFELERRF